MVIWTMRGLLIVYVSFFVSSCCLACSSKKFRFTYNDFAIENSYEMLSNSTHDCKLLVNEVSPLSDDRHVDIGCSTPLNGISQMGHGFLSLRGVNYDTRIVSFLHCNKSLEISIEKKTYNLPDNVNVTSITEDEYTMKNYTRKDIAVAISKLKPGEFEKESRYMFFMEYINKHNLEWIMTLRYEYVMYTATMRDAKPSKAARFAYRSLLADNTYQNLVDFVSKYGTSLRTGIVVGGVIEMIQEPSIKLLDHRNKMLDMLSANFSTKNREKIFMYGGDRFGKLSFENWKSSAKTNPATLSATLVDISTILVAENGSKIRTEKLKSIVSNIQNGNLIQKVRIGMELVRCDKPLCKVIIDAAKSEEKKVCVDANLAKNFANNIVWYNNVDLEVFYLYYQRIWTTDDEERMDHKGIPMLPGVCFTRSFKPEKNFYRRGATLPPGHRCVNFYEFEKCNGSVVKQLHFADPAVSEYINLYASLSLC